MERLRILLVLPAVAMLMTGCGGGGSRGSAISPAASAYIAGRVVDMAATPLQGWWLWTAGSS